MKRKIMGVFVILILTIALFSFSFFFLKKKNQSDNYLDNNINNQGSNTESQEFISENPNEDSGTEPQEVSKGISDSGGGGGSSGIISIITDLLGLGCEEKKITYSLTDINKTSICNENQDSICTDKTVICSINIMNRDNEVSGIFELQLFFAEAGNQNNVLKTSSSEFFLEPEEESEFKDSVSLQSTGEDGIANKEINCFFNTIEVPTKEVC